MPLDFRPVELTLDGLDQKTSAPMRVPGKLERAINVEYDKTGALNKRLGYQLIDLSNTVNLFDDDAIYCACTTYRNELVVFSYDYVSALGSRDALLRGNAALVYRGPANRGAVKLHHVSTSETSVIARETDGISALLLGKTYAGHDESDVAALTDRNGVFYRCYVWLNRNRWRIEAACYTEQEHGQPVLVFQSIVRELDQTQLDAGETLANPKIIPVGGTFVVHWIETDDQDVNVHRSTMDMEGFDASVSGWTYRNSLGLLNTHALYDVCPIIGTESDTDFILARYTATNNIRVERYDDFGILDTDWQTDIVRTIAPRVLAVYAHEADNDVVISYQPDAPEGDEDELWSAHLDADDGGSFVEAQTFVGFPAADYTQVGHCRVGSSMVAVVAEAVTNDLITAAQDADLIGYGFVRYVLYRQISSTNAGRFGAEHWCPNLNLVSRPWSYADGQSASGTSVDVYCVVSNMSVAPTQTLTALEAELEDDHNPQATAQPRQGHWRFSSIHVANLDYALWQEFDAGATVRPRLVGNVTSVGIPDGRPSLDFSAENIVGPTRRHNHLSYASAAPPYGPDIKTRTTAIGIFASMGSARYDGISIYEPQNMGIHGLKFYMEDPGAIFRDATDPEQPVDNFAGAYARSMFQTCEVGKALAIAGGTPHLYDGRQVVELGFPWCEILGIEALTGSSAWPSDLGAGGVAGTGTYSWYVVPTWRDAAGQVHRGPPSNIMTLTLSGAEDIVQMRVRTINTSLKDNEAHFPLATAINFEVFRTEAGGSIFYRVFGGVQGDAPGGDPNFMTLNTPVNDPTLITIDVFDGLADASLVLQGFAPFTLGPGGFIETTPQVVPAMHALTVWNGRLWGADQLDESILWYSDQILPDFASDFYRAPEFNDTNTLRIDGIGEVTAMQPMGDALVVFTRDGIYAVRGEGNDGTGQGATYTLEVMHTGIGCVEPRSVVLAPVGILFQSAKGITWLDRGGQLDYLTAGASVEDDIREAGNVRAATLMETKNQIRVVCNGRPVTTYTTTWTVGNADVSPGDWSITLTGTDSPGEIASHESAIDDANSEVAQALVDDIEAAIADHTTRVYRYLADVDRVGNTIVLEWQPDVVPAYSETAAAGGTLTPVDTSSLAVQPRVLLFDYLQRRWARGEVPDVNGVTERLNEAVGGCAWRGAEGTQCHVLLQQGGLRVERSERDADAYTDDSSSGTALAVRIDVKTAPIHLAGIAGCMRLRRIYAQMSKPNASQVEVDLDFFTSGDFDWPDDSDEGITALTYTPAGLEVCPRRQKMQAVAIRIHEPVGVTNFENVEIHSITLLAGLKKGLNRRGDRLRGTT